MGAIVWLASYPRSGNTWIRIFLHNLLSTSAAGDDGGADLDALDAFSTWDIAAHWYEPSLKTSPMNVTKDAVAAARPEAQRRIADSVDGLVFAKTHAALLRDRGTPTVDMQRTAGAVYIVRDPIDVAISYAAHMGIAVEDAVEVLNTSLFETSNGPGSVYEVYGSWSQNVDSWTRRPHPAVHVLRYEDLIDDPLSNYSLLARHLRIDATPEQLKTAAAASSFSRLSSIETKKGFRERPRTSDSFFRTGRAGEGRTQLAPQLIDRLIAHHGPVMQRFGYLP